MVHEALERVKVVGEGVRDWQEESFEEGKISFNKPGKNVFSGVCERHFHGGGASSKVFVEDCKRGRYFYFVIRPEGSDCVTGIAVKRLLAGCDCPNILASALASLCQELAGMESVAPYVCGATVAEGPVFPGETWRGTMMVDESVCPNAVYSVVSMLSKFDFAPSLRRRLAKRVAPRGANIFGCAACNRSTAYPVANPSPIPPSIHFV